MTTTNLTAEQIQQVLANFTVYRNAGSVHTGKWIYQPHDYDSSFELWSEAYDTKKQAIAAAYAELTDPASPPDDAELGL